MPLMYTKREADKLARKIAKEAHAQTLVGIEQLPCVTVGPHRSFYVIRMKDVEGYRYSVTSPEDWQEAKGMGRG